MTTQFAIGDAVEHYDRGVGTIVELANSISQHRVEFPNGLVLWVAVSNLKPIVFPIAAEMDPWRESEPAKDNSNDLCCSAHDPSRLYCTRVQGHDGHHVSRDFGGRVFARWHQSAVWDAAHSPTPPAEKRGPRVGDEVVRSAVEFQGSNVATGSRGKIAGIGPSAFGVKWEGRPYELEYGNHEFGHAVILAAEWDAQQTRDTTPCPAPTFVAGKPGQLPDLGPPPEGRFDFIIKSQALPPGSPPPQLMCTAKLASFARALFELDVDDRANSVADEGKGGIGKAETLERMWNNATAETKSWCEWRAAILLKRAGELP